MSIICYLPVTPHFSLPTTFKQVFFPICFHINRTENSYCDKSSSEEHIKNSKTIRRSIIVNCSIYLATKSLLRDIVTRFFVYCFFSIDKAPLIFLCSKFRVCSKIRGDIHNSRCITSVNGTGSKYLVETLSTSNLHMQMGFFN
jgi:hypothetical protein